MITPMHRYTAFGLTICSELELTGLTTSSTNSCDVEIRFGPVAGYDGASNGYSMIDQAALLVVPKVGRFLIEEGTRITISPTALASDRNIRLFVLGSALGAILHQRGIVPLHANGIAFDTGAVAFMGHSGAGKSTLASWFYDRGQRLLSDDVCALRPNATGGYHVEAGIPRLRLWRDVLQRTGRCSDDFELSYDGQDKFDVPASRDDNRAAPLRAIYLLRISAEDQTSIGRLKGLDAVKALVANTYRGGYLHVSGTVGAHLDRCVNIARSIPIFEAKRPWGYDTFESSARKLADHARSYAD